MSYWGSDAEKEADLPDGMALRGAGLGFLVID